MNQRAAPFGSCGALSISWFVTTYHHTVIHCPAILEDGPQGV
jgi:hypothetical protein